MSGYHLLFFKWWIQWPLTLTTWSLIKKNIPFARDWTRFLFIMRNYLLARHTLNIIYLVTFCVKMNGYEKVLKFGDWTTYQNLNKANIRMLFRISSCFGQEFFRHPFVYLSSNYKLLYFTLYYYIYYYYCTFIVYNIVYYCTWLYITVPLFDIFIYILA